MLQGNGILRKELGTVLRDARQINESKGRSVQRRGLTGGEGGTKSLHGKKFRRTNGDEDTRRKSKKKNHRILGKRKEAKW